MSKQDYIARIQIAVSQLHDCTAIWRETVPVCEMFHGRAIWSGEVEVFDLTGHAKAKQAYAWSHLDADGGERTQFVTILGIPPVDSPQTAVRAAIIHQVREGQK